MAARRACLECGAKKGVRAVTLYDDTDPDVFTSSRVHYCPLCLEKLDLICHEHNVLKIPMLRVARDEENLTSLEELEAETETGAEEEGEEDEDIQEYSIVPVDACTLCARDDVAALSVEERDRILALVSRLWEEVAADTLRSITHISAGVLKGMRPEDRALFSLALAARFEKISLHDFIFELFRQQSFESEARQ
ncbi:MAG: hypothetical protein Q7S95_00965 [bacterium]|nr:hypothetical protein [bacterium]